MSDATTLAVTGWKKHLEMRGYYSKAARSAQEPVQVFLNDQGLEIYFLSNVGKVAVFLEGDGEKLYQRDVDSVIEKTVFINLSEFEEGQYTLKIINDKGECLTGEFIR
ncbi:MAG: DUF3244 domain-containing protein [Dysgonamonadaceae bacterium]|nr:DUF3244 domain-containing protein [Dysgonamonadaceae bacterium]